MTRGLLIVDVQIDFCEGGALAVQGGNAVALRVAELIENRPGFYSRIFTSQDWHNPLPDTNGGHFAAPGEEPDYVKTWPVHCVAGTRGARIHPTLAATLSVGPVTGITKGMGRPDYSAFQGVNPFGLQMLAWELAQEEITDLDIVGLATDHCVRASAIDAIKLSGIREVRVITDLIAGVNHSSSYDALLEIQQLGGKQLTTKVLCLLRTTEGPSRDMRGGPS